MTRAVYLTEGDVEKFKAIAEFLRGQGAERAAGFVTSLILSWQLAEPVEAGTDAHTPPGNGETFRCHIDESAGLAEVHDFPGHSVKI